MKIVIDYGHCISGYDTGASGNGYREEICTREIGKRIKSKLEKIGHYVYAIAPDYSSSVRESLNVRVNSANSKSAEISISIHLNAGGGRGIEIYTKNGQAFSQATNILKNICEVGYVNRGIKDGSELAMVGSVWTTSMLIECGFIDNASDMKIYNPEKIADAIVKGLVGSTVSIPDRETSGESSNGGTINKNKYLNLSPSITSWRVYPLGKSPVVGNEVGKLAPSQYGGLSYLILGSPSVDIYTIETSVWGTVNIYVPSNDSSCSFTNSSNYGGSPSVANTIKYLNLSPSVSSWRVYPLDKNPVIGNEIGSLAPVTYGGLSYEIKGNPIEDVYTIITSVWGKVNIYAPRDNESTITSRASY